MCYGHCVLASSSATLDPLLRRRVLPRWHSMTLAEDGGIVNLATGFGLPMRDQPDSRRGCLHHVRLPRPVCDCAGSQGGHNDRRPLDRPAPVLRRIDQAVGVGVEVGLADIVAPNDDDVGLCCPGQPR